MSTKMTVSLGPTARLFQRSLNVDAAGEIQFFCWERQRRAQTAASHTRDEGSHLTRKSAGLTQGKVAAPLKIGSVMLVANKR